MPRVVDHEARRREIGSVALRLIATEGPAAASFRRVARECGLSLGAIQHYVASADDLLDLAVGRIGTRREERVRAQLEALGRPPSEREILEASLLTGLPLDEERRIECLAEAAVLTRGGAPRSTPAAAEGLPRLLDLFAGLLKAAGERGLLHDGVDPEKEARVLFALVAAQAHGLVLHHSTPDTVQGVLEYHLARVFRPESGRPAAGRPASAWPTAPDDRPPP